MRLITEQNWSAAKLQDFGRMSRSGHEHGQFQHPKETTSPAEGLPDTNQVAVEENWDKSFSLGHHQLSLLSAYR